MARLPFTRSFQSRGTLRCPQMRSGVKMGLQLRIAGGGDSREFFERAPLPEPERGPWSRANGFPTPLH